MGHLGGMSGAGGKAAPAIFEQVRARMSTVPAATHAATAVRDHPLRTLTGVEKTHRLPRFPTLARIEAALRDHPLRTPYGVEKIPRLLCQDDWRV